MSTVVIHWPHGRSTTAASGSDWLQAAQAAGFSIPTGCLGGSCGACEIDVNGRSLGLATAGAKDAMRNELIAEIISHFDL